MRWGWKKKSHLEWELDGRKKRDEKDEEAKKKRNVQNDPSRLCLRMRKEKKDVAMRF